MRISDWSSNVCSSDLTAIATAAFTARTTIAARFTRFAGRTRIFQFLTGFLVDNAHRQADLAPIVNFEDLDLPFLPFGKDIADFLNALIRDFQDVEKAGLAAHEVNESADKTGKTVVSGKSV